MLKRERQAKGVGSGTLELGDIGTLSQYPSVVDFLRQQEWEDGSRRVTGTLLICVEDGRWKLWAHDNDAKCSLWLSGETLADALEALEEGLMSGSGEWRRDRPKPGQGRR